MRDEKEIIMINAANMALEYKTKHPRNWDDDAVAHVMKHLVASPRAKLYGVAAANEVLKMRKDPSFKKATDKQIMQALADDIANLIAKIDNDVK